MRVGVSKGYGKRGETHESGGNCIRSINEVQRRESERGGFKG